MTEPARRAPGPAPEDDPERKPDPRAAGWGDVRTALIAGSRAVALAAAEMAARPGDPAALAMLGTAVRVMESLGVIASRCEFGEAVIVAERARAYRQGAADCKAARHRLEVIDGGAIGGPY